MSVTQNLKIIEVAGSVNVAANTSQVRVIWDSKQQGLSSYNNSTRTAKLYLSVKGGAETEYSINYTLPRDSMVTIVDKTITVTHNDDGTGRVKVRTWMDTGIIGTGVLEQSETLDLTTISRASSISRIDPRELGRGCYVQWTPNSEDFIFKLNFSLGTWSYTTDFIKPNQTTLYTYKDYILPMEVAEQIPNAATAEMKVILTTFNDGGTQIGSGSIAYFLVSVPANADTYPLVDLTVSPLNTGLPSEYRYIYIQGLSKLKTNISAIAKYGAEVAATTVTVDETAYNIDKPEILTKTGELLVRATAKDTRGRSGTAYKKINVIAYQKPYITAKSGESKIIVARCDASENLTNSGTYLKIKAKVVYSKVISGGKQYNYGKIKYKYREEGEEWSTSWTTIYDSETDSSHSDEVDTDKLLGNLDVKKNYQVQIIASDDFGESVPITFSISSDAVFMDRPAGGKSMGLGGYSSGDGNLDIHWNTKARGGLSLFDSKGDEIPLGSTMPLPRGELAAGDNLDALENGVHIVDITLQSGSTVIMTKGVLIQMAGDTGSNVKIQLALPDDGKYPRFRVCWNSTWSDWRTY